MGRLRCTHPSACLRRLRSLFLPILPVSDILQLAGVAPAADDAVGGAWVDAESGGEGGVGLAVKLGR